MRINCVFRTRERCALCIIRQPALVAVISDLYIKDVIRDCKINRNLRVKINVENSKLLSFLLHVSNSEYNRGSVTVTRYRVFWYHQPSSNSSAICVLLLTPVNQFPKLNLLRWRTYHCFNSETQSGAQAVVSAAETRESRCYLEMLKRAPSTPPQGTKCRAVADSGGSLASFDKL